MKRSPSGTVVQRLYLGLLRSYLDLLRLKVRCRCFDRLALAFSVVFRVYIVPLSRSPTTTSPRTRHRSHDDVSMCSTSKESSGVVRRQQLVDTIKGRERGRHTRTESQRTIASRTPTYTEGEPYMQLCYFLGRTRLDRSTPSCRPPAPPISAFRLGSFTASVLRYDRPIDEFIHTMRSFVSTFGHCTSLPSGHFTLVLNSSSCQSYLQYLYATQICLRRLL